MATEGNLENPLGFDDNGTACVLVASPCKHELSLNYLHFSRVAGYLFWVTVSSGLFSHLVILLTIFEFIFKFSLNLGLSAGPKLSLSKAEDKYLH